MDRLALMIHRLRDRLTDVHVTLDSHRRVDISHPLWFRDSDGGHPAPFTAIQAADLRSGRWTTTHPGAWDRTVAYLEALEAGGRYPHVVWPEHCLIGTGGHCGSWHNGHGHLVHGRFGVSHAGGGARAGLLAAAGCAG